uniref:Elongation of very long chain fatty acids protein n=1 Tax=Caenorhabditis japonica TaxID=281687 RepID=A0A8R1EVE9_CAEJA
MFLWTVSKVVDLFETMLLLVEGRRPLKIHIFHHFLSLSYAFTFYSLGFAIHRWIVFFNLCAHVILYSYLSGAKLFQSWTPCWVAVAASQMLQLILPLFVTLSVAAPIRACRTKRTNRSVRGRTGRTADEADGRTKIGPNGSLNFAFSTDSPAD